MPFNQSLLPSAETDTAWAAAGRSVMPFAERGKKARRSNTLPSFHEICELIERSYSNPRVISAACLAKFGALVEANKEALGETTKQQLSFLCLSLRFHGADCVAFLPAVLR